MLITAESPETDRKRAFDSKKFPIAQPNGFVWASLRKPGNNRPSSLPARVAFREISRNAARVGSEVAGYVRARMRVQARYI